MGEFTDADKLRMLATWFEDFDDGELRLNGREVQFELREIAERVESYVDKLFSLGAMEEAPCFVCGYNGPGYYQPNKHPCAERHHRFRVRELDE